MTQATAANEQQSREGHQRYPGVRLDVPKYYVDVPVAPAQLSEAVEAFDDNRIWSLYRQAPNREVFLDWLGNLASSTSCEIRHARNPLRNVIERHALFVVPLITKGGVSLPESDHEDNRLLLNPMRQQLEGWFGPGMKIGMYGCVFDYAEISTWSPAQLHALVVKLADKVTPLLRPSTSGVHLPRQAPRLGFLVGSMQQAFGFPEPPLKSPVQQMALREVLRAQLVLWTGVQSSVVQVGLPDFFSDGVQWGLLEWLELLAQEFPLHSWIAEPRHEDTVVLQMRCEDEDDGSISLPVRLHQIGPHALDLVFEQMARSGGKLMADRRPRQ